MIGEKVEQGYSKTVAGAAAQVIITTKDIHVGKTFITRLYVAT